MTAPAEAFCDGHVAAFDFFGGVPQSILYDMRDASSEPGCSRDQEQPCPDDDDSDGSRDALTGRCETFDGDGWRHDSHRAQVHDPDDEEDRRQAGTAVAAVEAGAQAVSPGRAGVLAARSRQARPLSLKDMRVRWKSVAPSLALSLATAFDTNYAVAPANDA